MKEELYTLHKSIETIEEIIINYKIAIHNLDRMGHNVEVLEKDLDNVGIELYKLKNDTKKYIKEKL